MEQEVTAMDLARTQAKRVRREVTILVQMLARLDENPNLQPEEAQGNNEQDN